MYIVIGLIAYVGATVVTWLLCTEIFYLFTEDDMKTEEEVRDLKAQWQADPIWDIETTEGFEAHREELLAFRRKCEGAWEKAAKYRNERSSRHNIDAAVDAMNDGDRLGVDEYNAAMLNYSGAIAHALVAIAAELKAINERMEGP